MRALYAETSAVLAWLLARGLGPIWLLWWTWCLPQTALGALVHGLSRLFARGRGARLPHRHVVAFCRRGFPGGLSLGPWIVVGQPSLVAHEYGHSLQSMMLGPAYLLVIGIPSFLWACRHRLGRPRRSCSELYTEAWADRLGRVGRGGAKEEA